MNDRTTILNNIYGIIRVDKETLLKIQIELLLDIRDLLNKKMLEK